MYHMVATNLGDRVFFFFKQNNSDSTLEDRRLTLQESWKTEISTLKSTRIRLAKFQSKDLIRSCHYVTSSLQLLLPD